MKDNILPEEKLLRLIRKEKKADREPERKASLAKMSSKAGVKFSVKPKEIILTAFIASSLYLIVSLIYPLLSIKKNILPEVKQEAVVEPKPETIEGPKPYDFYLSGIKEREIFSSSQIEVVTKPQSGINTDLLKDISLVGIIAGDTPQAIIEDKKTQKTYYLNKGQFIEEMQVEDIQEGKIILNYRGEKFELYL
ncbi:MAG: hypothetical protein AABY43_01530 [Candidatus Omnitrophota bacterium]